MDRKKGKPSPVAPWQPQFSFRNVLEIEEFETNESITDIQRSSSNELKSNSLRKISTSSSGRKEVKSGESSAKIEQSESRYLSDGDLARSSSSSNRSAHSSAVKRKKTILEKILNELHISPKSQDEEISSPDFLDTLCLPPPPVVPKKGKQLPSPNIFKDILQSTKPSKKSFGWEPNEKLCEKYGICQSGIIGKGATCNVRYLRFYQLIISQISGLSTKWKQSLCCKRVPKKEKE